MAKKNFTFSDGTTVPKGSFVTAPVLAIHMDNEKYEDALSFNPWRFSNIREEDGEGTKHQYVATSEDFLPFGYGKHAW